MATQKQLEANQANSQLSTGPVTAEGKSICSHNAVKTGLTGQTVLLKTDDVEAYNRHLQRFTTKFQPATDDERDLIQDLADTEWRLLRIVPLETGILALGRRKLAAQFADEADAAVRDALLDAEVALVYRRDLSNLSLQHMRLRRHRDVVTKELTELQQKRREATRRQSMRAAEAFLVAVKDEAWECFDHTDFGSDFSLEQMYESVAHIRNLAERMRFPEVTKLWYVTEARKQYNELFGDSDEQASARRPNPKPHKSFEEVRKAQAAPVHRVSRVPLLH